MKKMKYALFAILILVPLLVGFLANGGDLIKPIFKANPGVLWRNLGTITGSTSTPAVGSLDYSTMNALTVASVANWTAPEDVHTLELRFQTDADADSTTVELYGARGEYYADDETEDSYTLATTLVLTGGTQVGPNGNVFVDTIAATDTWISSGQVADPAANRICHYAIRLHGYKKWIVIATTLQASSTLYVDGSWYCED